MRKLLKGVFINGTFVNSRDKYKLTEKDYKFLESLNGTTHDNKKKLKDKFEV